MSDVRDEIAAELNADRPKDPWAEQMRDQLESIQLELLINDPEALTIKVSVPHNYNVVQTEPNYRIKVRKENIDPEGIFIISIEPVTNKMRVAWFKHTKPGEEAELSELYYGQNSVSIYDTIITNHPSLQPSSAAALGYDLAIAEGAIKKGLGYLPVKLVDLL